MKLSERLKSGRQRCAAEAGEPGDCGLDVGAYNSVKSMVHVRLVEQLDLSSVADLPRESLADAIRETLQEITAAESLPLNKAERSMLASDLMNEIMGLGPLEPLMADASVQDILVNGCMRVYVEKEGVLKLTPIRFRDDDHLMQVIDRLVSAVGRRVDESSPMVDARLADGSRVNVIIPPLSLNGPVLSIRKFSHEALSMRRLIESGSLTREMEDYMRAAVKTRLNVLISGGTGVGKTTLLNILTGFIPDSERIITIEDSAELRLHQSHVISLEARPGNVEGRGSVTLTDLVRNSLRMRPDRIIVGETRGGEVMDMLQAMNTGHPGSMGTIHANTPRDALSRIQVMADMGASSFSERALKGLVSSALDVIVQLARLPDGKRRITCIAEVTGMQGENISTQEVFSFEQEGVDGQGCVQGAFRGSGVASSFLEHFKAHGMPVNPDIFTFRREVR
ncbi:MAG: CpaF family protein [Syntrophobacteraceae bacterium]